MHPAHGRETNKPQHLRRRWRAKQQLQGSNDNNSDSVHLAAPLHQQPIQHQHVRCTPEGRREGEQRNSGEPEDGDGGSKQHDDGNRRDDGHGHRTRESKGAEAKGGDTRTAVGVGCLTSETGAVRRPQLSRLHGHVSYTAATAERVMQQCAVLEWAVDTMHRDASDLMLYSNISHLPGHMQLLRKLVGGPAAEVEYNRALQWVQGCLHDEVHSCRRELRRRGE